MLSQKIKKENERQEEKVEWLECPYLPQKFYLDKNFMPLQEKIEKKVLTELEKEKLNRNISIEELVSNAIWETLHYLKPKEKE